MANRNELIAQVAENMTEATGEKVSQKGQGVSGEAAVNAVFDAIEGLMVTEGEVNVTGFGTFSVKTQSARKGRNPSTGEEIDIPEKQKVAFKPKPALKEYVNNQ